MSELAKQPVVIHVCSARVREVRSKVVSKSRPNGPHVVTAKGRDLVVHCDCESFKYRKRCSHVEVVDQECGWNSGRSAVRQVADGVCPICGSGTEQVLAGR